MDRPLTQADADEIMAHMNRVDPEHKRIWIDQNEDGWMIGMSNGEAVVGFVHPRTFLDIIRDESPGETVLKTV